jgi:transposase
VRDQRPWAGDAPPGAVYRFAPNWKEEHVLDHLANASGILQADGYKGYAKLYAPGPDGLPRLCEAACWAHLSRDFHDFWTSTKSEIAREALDRIGKLYDIERDINGQPADVRQTARQKYSLPKVEAFFAWSEQQLLRIPGKSNLAKAFRYGLNRQEAFSLFLADGRVAIDNNPAERALRPIGIGRKNSHDRCQDFGRVSPIADTTFVDFWLMGWCRTLSLTRRLLKLSFGDPIRPHIDGTA